MTKKLTKVAMTTALAAAAIVPAVVATPAQAAEAEVTFAKAYYTTANGTAAFEAGKLGSVISTTKDTNVTYVEGSNGEVFDMKTFSAYFAANKTATTNEVLTALSKAGKALSADQVKALNVKKGDVVDGKVTVDADAPVGDVKVESVKAINPSTIAIELNQEVKKFDVADLTAAPALSFDKVESIEGNVVYVSLKTAAAFNTTYKVTIKDQGTFDVAFKGVNDYFKLQFSYDAKDNNNNGIVDIPATGASTLQVTAQVVDLQGNPVDTEGVIRFTTTEGGIAQGEKTLQKGKAAIQLTSEASLNESLFASITGEIIGSSKLIGLKSSDIVEFKPEGGKGEVQTAVNVVKVESAQADRFQVVLGAERTKLTEKQLEDVKKAIKVTDGIKKGEKLAVKEVEHLSPTVLEVVLDTEADARNHFTDNAKHNVEFEAVKDVLTASNLDFILTDTSKQFVLGVEAPSQDTLLVKYSEPVAYSSGDKYFVTYTADEEKLGLGKEGEYKVDKDGFLIRGTATDSASPEYAAYFGNLYKNYAIDGVTLDKDTQFTLSEDRKTVKISLVKKDRIKVAQTNLEIKNVGDWAGTTDAKNRISTQRIEFTATLDNTIPAVSVVRHSPEQFLLTVDKNVTLKTGTKLAEALETRYGKVLDQDAATGTGKKGDLETLLTAQLNASTNPKQVVYTAYDKDWEKVTDPTAKEFKYILVELTDDWTNIVSGENYWVAAPTVQFKLAKDLLSTDLDNKNVALDAKVSNERDRKSPAVAVDNTGKKVFKQVKQTIEYSMDEPVQVVSDGKDLNEESSSKVAVTPNNEQKTSNNSKVQATEINFEKDGVVVPGVVTELDPTDFHVTAQASYGSQSGDAALEAAVKAYNEAQKAANKDFKEISHFGKWTVTITGTPDDFGNTMATEEFVDAYVIAEESTTPSTPLVIDPFVVYGQYYNNVNAKTNSTTPDVSNPGEQNAEFDVILVKFSEVMANTGANAVGDTTNYVLNGKTLADLGSSIEKGIDGVTSDWDGITIKLPAGTLGADANFVLTLANNMVSQDNSKKLTKENELNFVDTDLDTTDTNTSVYQAKSMFANFTDSKALTPAKALEDLFIKPGVGSTVASAYNEGDDKNLAKDLTVKFTLQDAKGDLATATGLVDNSTSAKPLQVVVNGKVVTAVPTIASGVVTLNIAGADAKSLAIKEGDRVEVKVNGQTVSVAPAAKSNPNDLNGTGPLTGNYVISSAGPFGPTGSVQTSLTGDITVNADSTLQNLQVNGTIYINPGPSGTVTLNNVNATSIVILSGGTNSIYLNKVTTTNLTVKDDDSIRIQSNTGTTIQNTSVQSGAILDANGGSFGTIELAPTTSAAVELRGNFTGSSITVPSGATVGRLVVASNANAVTVNNQGAITEVKADASVAVTGNDPVNKTDLDAEQALITFLNTAKGFDYSATDTPAEGNYKAIADLAINGTNVTMDASNDADAIAAIVAKDGIVTKAEAAGKELNLYATDVYVMNTFARYVGALERQAAGTVKEIKFNGATYLWDGDATSKGSKWKSNGTTLISAVVTQQNTSIRNVELILVDADNKSINVTFNAKVAQ